MKTEQISSEPNSGFSMKFGSPISTASEIFDHFFVLINDDDDDDEM